MAGDPNRLSEHKWVFGRRGLNRLSRAVLSSIAGLLCPEKALSGLRSCPKIVFSLPLPSGWQHIDASSIAEQTGGYPQK